MSKRAGCVRVHHFDELEQEMLDVNFVVRASKAESRRGFERVAASVVGPVDEGLQVAGASVDPSARRAQVTALTVKPAFP